MSLTPELSAAFAERWYAAWNAGDLDAVMACYDDSIEHSSPFIARFNGTADGSLRGKPAVRDHPELTFAYLSEEHGTFLAPAGAGTSLDVGATIAVHPGHCCAAANLHDRVYATRNGVVEEVWLVTARGRSQ